MTNRALTFGIKTAQQQNSYEEILKVWRAADEHPAFEHAWLFDHFAPIFSDLDGPCLEGWTLLAALAAETSHLRLGLMVTGNTYRHPAVLAKTAATVDIISNGRLDFGIGAGWNEYEHRSMGIPLYTPGERLRRFGEACEVIKSLFTEKLTTFSGRYYRLEEARCEPKPIQKPYPPFVIGGSGEQLTLRIVAQHADIWNYPSPGTNIDEFKRKQQVLSDHCIAVGRDPAEVLISVQPRINYEDLEQSRQIIQGLVDAGATHVVLNLSAPYPDDIVPRLADGIVEKINVKN